MDYGELHRFYNARLDETLAANDRSIQALKCALMTQKENFLFDDIEHFYLEIDRHS